MMLLPLGMTLRKSSNGWKYIGLKPGSLADPNIYLGARVKLMELKNGDMVWWLIPSKYVQEAVKNVETYVKNKLG